MKKLLTILLTVLLAVTTITFNVAADNDAETATAEPTADVVGEDEKKEEPTEVISEVEEEITEPVEEVILEANADNADATVTLVLGEGFFDKRVINASKGWESATGQATGEFSINYIEDPKDNPDVKKYLDSQLGKVFDCWASKSSGKYHDVSFTSTVYGEGYPSGSPLTEKAHIFYSSNETLYARYNNVPIINVYSSETKETTKFNAKLGSTSYGTSNNCAYITYDMLAENTKDRPGYYAAGYKLNGEVLTEDSFEDTVFEDNQFEINNAKRVDIKAKEIRIDVIWKEADTYKLVTSNDQILYNAKYIIVSTDKTDIAAHAFEGGLASMQGEWEIFISHDSKGLPTVKVDPDELENAGCIFIAAKSEENGIETFKLKQGDNYLHRSSLGDVFEGESLNWVVFETDGNGSPVKIVDETDEDGVVHHNLRMKADGGIDGEFYNVRRDDMGLAHTWYVSQLLETGTVAHLYQYVDPRTQVSATVDDSRLVYDGRAKQPWINLSPRLQLGKDYTVKYTNESGEEVSVVNAGTYKAVITLNDDTKYYFIEDSTITNTITREFTVKKASVDVRRLVGQTYEYDTKQHNALVWLPLGCQYDDQEGKYVHEATNAGSYTAAVKLSDPNNYKWSDDSADEYKEVAWTINKMYVVAATDPIGRATEHEDGLYYSPVITFSKPGSGRFSPTIDVTDLVNKEDAYEDLHFYESWDVTKDNIEDHTEIKPQDVFEGKYTVAVVLKEDANFTFERRVGDELADEKDSTKDYVLLQFEVKNKVKVNPSLDPKVNLVYNNEGQVANLHFVNGDDSLDGIVKVHHVTDSKGHLVEDAVDAGDYVAYLDIIDPENYEWAEDAVLDRTKTYAVVKFTVDKKEAVIPSFQSFTYNGKYQSPELTEGVKFAEYGDNKEINANADKETYKAWVVLDKNYKWPESAKDKVKTYTDYSWEYPFVKEVEYVEVSWKIYRAKATVTISHDPITYGDDIPSSKEYKFDPKGFYNDDFRVLDDYIVVTLPAGAKDAGTYPLTGKLNITGWFSDHAKEIANNYDIDFKGSLTIKKAKLTASLLLPEEGYVYDGTKKEPGVKLDGYKYPADEKLPFVVEYNVGLLENSVDAGDKYARVYLGYKLAKNYYLEGENLLGYVYLPYTIAPKKLTAYWVDRHFVYDGEFHSPTLIFKDVDGKDHVPDSISVVQIDLPSFMEVPDTYENESNEAWIQYMDAGKYQSVGFIVGKTSNYDIANIGKTILGIEYARTTFDIEARKLHIDWQNKYKFAYNGKPQVPSFDVAKQAVNGIDPILDAIVDRDKDIINVEYTEDGGAKTSTGDHTAAVEVTSTKKLSHLTSNYVIENPEIAFKIYKVVPDVDPVKTGVE